MIAKSFFLQGSIKFLLGHSRLLGHGGNKDLRERGFRTIDGHFIQPIPGQWFSRFDQPNPVLMRSRFLLARLEAEIPQYFLDLFAGQWAISAHLSSVAGLERQNLVEDGTHAIPEPAKPVNQLDPVVP